MKNYELSFCEIIAIEEAIFEVITFPDVEVNDEMVDEYHAFWARETHGPFAIMINRKHPYSYTFSAMRRIGDIPGLRAVAALHRSARSERTQAVVNQVRPKNPLNMQHFYTRANALSWLRSELSGARQAHLP